MPIAVSMFNYHGGLLRSVVRLKRRWVSTQVVKHRNTNGQLQTLKRPHDVAKYEFPRNPDALLVEGTKLTRGERLYQGFSIGFPVIAFITLMSIPIGLVTFFAFYGAKSKEKAARKVNSRVDQILDTTPLPRLLTAKDLKRLIHVKRPAIVIYFRKEQQGDDRANQLNLMFVLLKEIGELNGSPIDVYRVDVKEEFQYFNKYLKEDIQSSGATLLHLVIPESPESHVLTISPPTSAVSFVSQLSNILGDFHIKFSKSDGETQDLDNVLMRLKRCMFELKLEGITDFIEGHNLQQLEMRCNQLLQVGNPKPQH